MKKKILVFFVFSFFNSLFMIRSLGVGLLFADKLNANSSNSLLTVVIMVKDEAKVIKETLQPFVESSTEIKKQLSFFVFDTGSTDSTMSIADQYFKENEIKDVVIEQEPFIDFAMSRNRALELAEQAFPKTPFILMLDAEWIFKNVEELIKFCQENKNEREPSYLVRIISNSYLDYHVRRLIRSRCGVRFIGEVHEYLNRISPKKLPSNCFFEWNTTAYGQEKSRKRWSRDLGILIKSYEKNPNDPRTVFYTAQTYHCLGDLENARAWYEKRVSMVGWDQEDFAARYRLAKIYEQQNDWENALNEYINAFAMRPSRAEPLIKIAHHYYKKGQMALCFLFSKRATEIPYPDDILFVDKELYLYERYNLLGISAWYVGEYKMGYDAVQKALEVHPEYLHLHTNLNFYNSKIKEMQEDCSKDLPYITIAILAKDKAHILPLYLSCIENQTWPKDKTFLYIRTNNNNDNTEEILKTWVEKVRDKYALIYFDNSDVTEQVERYRQHEWNHERFKVLGKIRQDSIDWAYENKSHYFVVDCDNIIAPHTLQFLEESNLPIIAPLLRTGYSTSIGSKNPWYSNFHADIDANGYYKSCDLYYKLLEQKIRGLVEVPVVHCTYFIRYEELNKIYYDDQSGRYEYVIFSDSARRQNIPQYLDTRDMYGYISFAENEADMLAEPWLNEIPKLGLC